MYRARLCFGARDSTRNPLVTPGSTHTLKIIIDTREQHPLKFTFSDNMTEVVSAKLEVGDYCAEYTDGERAPIVFERKAMGDLFGTSTSGYKRFKAEINRAKASHIKMILAIEGNQTEIVAGYAYSAFNGLSMLRKLCTMWLKYDLMPMFFDSRESMAVFIQEFYEAYGRLYKQKQFGHRK